MMDRPLVVVDVETTGLSPRYGDRIVEIALLRLGAGREERFQSLVNPDRFISPRATAIHGITEEMVARAPRFGDLARRIWPLLDGAVLIGHNLPFDWSFLAAERRRLGLPPLDNPLIDTLTIARRHFTFTRNSLAAVSLELGLDVPVRHRAMADVITTWEVLKHFRRALAERGITALEALYLPVPAAEEDDRPPLPPELAEALGSRRRLKLRYVSSHRVETVREVEPLEVMPLGDYLYLRAFCHLRGDERTFRLDRVVALESAASAEPPAEAMLPLVDPSLPSAGSLP
jgi:DNA polymerase-3 subunit epsilon